MPCSSGAPKWSWVAEVARSALRQATGRMPRQLAWHWNRLPTEIIASVVGMTVCSAFVLSPKVCRVVFWTSAPRLMGLIGLPHSNHISNSKP